MTKKALEDLESQVTPDMENKYMPTFSKQACYKGNGIYQMGRNMATDTRELFLMFVADMEDLEYDGKEWEEENEVE